MKKTTILCVLILFFISCGKDNVPSISLKLSKNDPFKSSIVKSQFFEINNKKDTVIIGKQGTKIVIPKNAFIDKKGNPITKNVKVELAEAYLLSDIILSNLTTTSNGKLLETDGMIFINATQKEKNLKIDKTKPLYIEMPTKKKKANMKLYDGIRNENGNMNWINPKPLKNYLIPIDLDLLDFLPDGFENEAINYLNFHQIKPTKKAIDSLYYNLPFQGQINATYKVNKGGGIYISCDIINPSSIQTIKTNKFNNTFIATKEFEERIKTLHRLCKDNLIGVYAKNLKLDLWKVDSLAIQNLTIDSFPIVVSTDEVKNEDGINKDVRVEKITGYGKEFNIENEDISKLIQFKNQKLTNVELKNTYINELKSFYEIRLKENIKKSDSLRNIGIIKEQNSEIIKAYKKVLKEREKITKQAYGFVQSELGWVNIDRGTTLKNWNYQQINIRITNKKRFNQVHAYLIFSEIKSISKFIPYTDNVIFTTNENLPIPKNSEVTIVVISFLNNKNYFKTIKIKTKDENSETTNIDLLLELSDLNKIKKELIQINDFEGSTSVIKDLELSKAIQKEDNLKKRLLEKAMHCCDINPKKKSKIKKDSVFRATAILEFKPE